MKSILFVSTFFFLLGVQISKMIDLGEKVNVMDKIISNQIFLAKPLKAFSFFKDTEDKKASTNEEKDVKSETIKDQED